MSAPRIEDVLALSPLQEGLFSLSKLTGDGIDLYTMQFVVDIDGPLDVALLRASAQAMLVRHPNLRVSFWDTDVPKPVQIVPSEAELPWTERYAEPSQFDTIAESERRKPFDLSRGPALRILLLTVPGSDNDTAASAQRRMILTAHHILMDGWAVAVFTTELLAIYQAGGSPTGLPQPRPYRDYIGWLAAQDTAAATATWVEYLGRVSSPLMVADGAATVRAGAVPETTRLTLPAAETERLQRWARRSGLTLNTAVQFAWTVLLGRLTDRRDVVFGTTISGRPEQLSGVEQMIGLFINTVPVAVRIDETASVVEQCAALQRESAAMRDIGYLSLSSVQRATEHGTLFDTLFVFENAPIDAAIQTVTMPDGARFRPIEMESLAHYPLTVVSHLAGAELVVLVEAVPEALPQLPAEQIGERLLSILRQLPDIGAGTPAALDVLTASEHADLATTVPAPQVDNLTAWELFERQAAATPDAPALSSGSNSGDERYTYRELRDAAARLAAELADHGVGPETVAALVLPRSARSIIGLFAVLAAGGAYVPVDITLPSTRIDSILNQSRPTLLLTTEDSRELLAGRSEPVLVLDDPEVIGRVARRAAETPAVPRVPSHCAYLIFTSGSTGEPKGVAGTNSALAAYFADHRDRVYRPAQARLGRPLRIAHAWSLSFDASWQPMVGLLAGQHIHLFDSEEMRDAHRLVEGMTRHGIDMIDTTPSMFAQLSAAGLLDRGPAVLALGGEAIDQALWSRLRALTGTAVYNCYGPTETTVEAVVAAIADTTDPTIGTANAGTAAYVLDSRLRPAPRGVVGELYLSGAQLARGYIGRPAGTAARFVADPFRPGHRMYRTGDLVRRLGHGGLAYLGRADDQVKVRGYRVEVGEIETALRRLPGVATATVTVVRRAGGASLVGFVVAAPGRVVDPAQLRIALTDRLPAYMVPARIVILDRLPVNANGKLDGHELARRAEQALSHGVAEGERAVAETETEQALSEVFAELFDGRIPGIDDDFFAIGVDSIVAISLVSKARRRGLAVNPRMVLAAPSIRELAAAITSASAASPTDSAADTAEYGEVLPLPIVSWMYEYGRYRRFTQTTLLRLPTGITGNQLEAVLQAALDGYDTLRSRLADTPDGLRLITTPPGSVRAADILTRFTPAHTVIPAGDTVGTSGVAAGSNSVAIGPHHDAAGANNSAVDSNSEAVGPYGDTAGSTGDGVGSAGAVAGPTSGGFVSDVDDPFGAGDIAVDWNSVIAAAARAAMDQIDPRTGDMVRAVWFPGTDEGDILMLAVHHLAVDVVSWHILLAGLAEAWTAIEAGSAPKPLPEFTSYRRWSQLMWQRASEPEVLAQRDFWAGQLAAPDPEIGSRVPDPVVDTWSSLRVTSAPVGVAVTERILAALSKEEGVREFLLAALTMTLASWRRERAQDPRCGALIALEGHGRADTLLGTDTTNTLGWFTSVFPVRLGAGTEAVDVEGAEADPAAARALVDSVVARLDAIPNDGLDYGLLRYVTRSPELTGAAEPQVEFNYLGRVDLAANDGKPWSMVTGGADTALPLDPEPDLPLRYALDVIAAIGSTPEGPQLHTNWRWGQGLLTEADADRLAELWQRAVTALAAALDRRTVDRR
ncbi:non-ribosomal peptide synthetase [Nocardia donostiensis]|uniref:non-ribosomal peptide synthetase n=1 Tax=Nocardia donostiensis TaxID=1538463 RepID=UPI0009DB0564|nr:non-ribosomal peptide synthetase [Nocardia donostiensis]